MQDKEKFLELLKEAVEMARVDNKVPTKEEVKSWFQGMDLTEEQYRYINTYLRDAVRESHTATDALPLAKHSSYVNMYLKEIRDIQPLSEEEKTRMYRSLLRGEAGVKNQLVESNLSKVLAVTRRFKSGVHLEGFPQEELLQEELIQEGNLALITAMDSMPSNEVLRDTSLDDKSFYKKCENYITGEIKKGITAYLEMEVGLSDLKRSVVAKSALIYEATKHLAEETGTLANVQELSEYVKMPKDEIMEIVELSNGALKIAEG